MSSEFPYASLKCILEYLEANKRIHICARSPPLHKIEKKIPLHINRLNLFYGSIGINEIDYSPHCDGEMDINNPEQVLADGEFRDWTEVTMPGDIFMESVELQDKYMLLDTRKMEIRNRKRIEFRFYRKFGHRASATVPDIPFNIAQKKVADVLLGGRCVIHVSNIHILHEILRLPVGLNFRIKHLDVDHYDIKNLVSRIDPLSLPLKTINFEPKNPEIYHNPIVQTAETCRINSYENLEFLEPWHRTVLSLPHKHIIMSNFEFDEVRMFSVIQDWLDHPRETGKSLVMHIKAEVVNNLCAIRKRFNGKVVLTPKIRTKSHFDDYRDIIYHKAILLPINTTTVQLLVTSGNVSNIRKWVKLEMVPIDSINPMIPASLSYWDVICCSFCDEPEFTYPSFKCILEYLEANKRIHICSRSKALQKIDKKVPLHIKSLDFGWRSIRVNDIETELRSESYWYNEEEKEKVLVDAVFRNWDQVVMPGDVSMTDGEVYKLSNTEDLEIRNQIPFELKFIRDETEEPRASPNIPYQIALKKVAKLLFGGRCLIYVSEIEALQPVLRLPVGFNIRIRRFLNIGGGNIENLLNIVDPRSFPLKSIMLGPTAPKNYYHQIVQTAESLEIYSHHSVNFLKPWHEEVLSLPHKHIKMIWPQFEYEAMISVVQDWLDHPREHGRTLAVWYLEETPIEMLYQIKNRFKGKMVLISENNVDGICPKAVIIPIDSTSELLISFNDKEGMKLESVLTGKSQSTIQADFTYFDVIWSNPSKYHEPIVQKLAEAFITLIVCIFGCGIIILPVMVLYHDVLTYFNLTE
ncbi:unnamed protein product [Caenorhabditis brenneri]